MNKVEHLLTCLIEEAAEIQHAATKALRFGLLDGYPGGTTTNADDITKELNHLYAVVELIDKEKLIGGVNPQEISEKKVRVAKYMEYARTTGSLTD